MPMHGLAPYLLYQSDMLDAPHDKFKTLAIRLPLVTLLTMSWILMPTAKGFVGGRQETREGGGASGAVDEGLGGCGESTTGVGV